MPRFMLIAMCVAAAATTLANAAPGKHRVAQARAQSPAHVVNHLPASPQADPNNVYLDGQLIGRDPDPNIRAELKNDYYATVGR